MRVIITGGTGLIGRALAASLASDGHEVIILSRTPERFSRVLKGVRLAGWDGRTSEGWGSLADGSDAIVNLAGETIGARWTAERKRRITESRIDAGQAVVQAVEQSSVKPRVVVQASGAGYYGPRGGTKLTEDDPPGSDWAAQVAVRWEAATLPVEALGVRRVVIRSGVVLSTRGGALPRMALPFRSFVGGPLANGRQWFSWIHIADEVAAIRFLIESEAARGPFNLTAPGAVNNAQFSQALGRAMRRPALVRTPAFALRLVFGEMASTILEGQRAVPSKLASLGFKFSFPDVESALAHLFSNNE